MDTALNRNIHSHTPQLAAFDSRGLPVRQVSYWRREITELIPEALVTAQQHDSAGRLVAQRDPRFLAHTVGPNMATVFSLAGKEVSRSSVDSGWTLQMAGEAGLIRNHWDSRGSHWKHDYDPMQRLTATHEQTRGSAFRTIERLTYADNRAGFAAQNQCGQLIRFDDTAGTLHSEAYGLLGQRLVQRRHFLKTLQSPDWPLLPEARNELLEPGEGFQTRRDYSPSNDLVRQTDARSHRQSWHFDRAGQLQQVRLQLKDDVAEKVMLHSVGYSAQGQTESQTSGNGTTTHSQFDPANGRLQRLVTERVGRGQLQDLGYTHDAAGNVVELQDHAQPTHYFANQLVESTNHYVYDSLSRLISASGREVPGQNIRPELPELTLGPGDSSRLLNYTEHYEYDKGGNLTLLRHQSGHPGQAHRRPFKVADESNRALPWDEQLLPDFGKGFDLNGNLQALHPHGQLLRWSGQNQLQQITVISRKDNEDDAEYYVYDHQHLRVRKHQRCVASGMTHVRNVRYLPGLEIRTQDDGEHLEVITVQTERGQVRCLHWVTPPPDGIRQDQLRFCLNDHLGSSTLELDDQAEIISHEGYYPYGGTAWWAARSKVEADYKTVRYSGKERDASGLYDYGLRYYAPWLCRWINPDPFGSINGLNLYRFCGNNPVCRIDPDGRMWQPYDDETMDDFLRVEPDLRAAYSLEPIEAVDESMDYQTSPVSPDTNRSRSESSRSDSENSPGSPPAPTDDQNILLNIQDANPNLSDHFWNSRNLLQRTSFGGKVYRADLRSPEELKKEGFKPSEEFTAVDKMVSGDSLIVAETLEGAMFYAAQAGRPYYFYEIDASNVGGVSLLENLVLNSPRMLVHLNAGAGGSPSEQTGEANRMHEAHLNFDDLDRMDLDKKESRVFSMGQLVDEMIQMRLSMNR
jgi:insecticidal toxin complex protein TccC